MNANAESLPGAERTVLTTLHVAAALCLACISLWHPATTRMWSWPSSLALGGVLVLPLISLSIRTLMSREPVTLPSTAWCGLALAWIAIVVMAALASLYRGPSLRWSAPLLGGVPVFFLVHDWLQREPGDAAKRRARLHLGLVLAFLPLGLASVTWWLGQVREFGLTEQLLRRNPYPLGHASYIAGASLIALPVAVAAAWRERGAWRVLAGIAAAIALLMLLSSSSRGGLLGLAVLVAAGLWCAPFPARTKWLACGAGALVALGVIGLNPRTRAMLSRTPGSESTVAASNVQRTAMLTAAWRMGHARPLLGWGPGTTPLAYPRFRGELAGGAENVLQLHSLPAHLWAELGLGGIACLLVFGFLVARDGSHDPVAAIALGGYGVFSLTDWQLDIPLFNFALAALCGSIASGKKRDVPHDRSVPRLVPLVAALLAAAAIAVGARPDPTPEMNARALLLARDPAQAAPAIALLRESLALNPDQEIAHFNLGWLFVTRDPAAAEAHFLAAARLVPDKGGVYFGLGLARLNHGRSTEAARAFALECLNDPAFLVSPWWREPAIAATREAATTALKDLLQRAHSLAPDQAAALERVAAAASELGRPPAGTEKVYRRERVGYPVLMRTPDLAAPFDLFDVRELRTPPAWVATLPPKGWLPSPVLLALLDASVSPKP